MIRELAAQSAEGGRLFLVGDTTQLCEGWIPSVAALRVATESGSAGARLATDAQAIAARCGIPLVFDSPADVMPLPDGSNARHRVSPSCWPRREGQIDVHHYDPYSVIGRGIVRGDQSDYDTALRYLRHGWVDVEQMIQLFADLLPRLSDTSIAQDPAEFRRKLRGLVQMWRAETARSPSSVPPAS